MTEKEKAIMKKVKKVPGAGYWNLILLEPEPEDESMKDMFKRALTFTVSEAERKKEKSWSIISYLAYSLKDNEELLLIEKGTMDSNNYFLAVSNQKVLAILVSTFKMNLTEIRFNEIQGVEVKRGSFLSSAQIIIHTKIKTFQFEMENNERAERFRMQIMDAIDHQTNRNTQGISVADELLKLKQLLDTGVISELEFKSQKEKLLKG